MKERKPPASDAERGFVVAVANSSGHTLSKQLQARVEIVAGHGVAGDAHGGTTVKHRSRVAIDPTQPNLRQVHLMHAELFDELREQGLEVGPGEMGENLTTRGLDLLALPTAAHLHVGETVVLEVTGLRNPCGQLNRVQPGLLAATRIEDGRGGVERKAGIMCIVLEGGFVAPGDPIRVEAPAGPGRALEAV